MKLLQIPLMPKKLTKSAVVLPCPMHGAVGEYLQLKACPAVELTPPQDPLKVAEVCGRPLLQPAFDLPQPLAQPRRRLRQGRACQRREAL